MLAANRIQVGAATSGLKRLRTVALRRLAGSRFGYRLFQGLGRCYGVEDLGIRGDFGLVTGALRDAAVLRAYAANGFWARAANQFFCDFFARAGGGTYLDIGANIGLTTIPTAQNPRVSCKAFEPVPHNFRYLSHNVAINCPHANVGLFPLALFDRRTSLHMGVAARNSGDARIRSDEAADGGERPSRIVTVPAERLDDVLTPDDLPRPIAVKIVTQGAEGRVIAGGQRLLAAADAVVLEFDPALILGIDQTIDATTEFLARHFATAAPLRGPDFETGAQHHPLVWRPMAEMIEEMRHMMRQPAAPGADYYYVYVRR